MGSASDGTHGVAVQQLIGTHTTVDSTSSAKDRSFNCSESGGIQDSGICCLESCGQCSGNGCSSRKGGAKGCCSSEIHHLCSSTVGAPCRIDGQPGPAPTPRTEPDANANKTWLLFADAIIASGVAEIPQFGGLVTSVEQMILQGPVHVGDARSGSLLPDGSLHHVDLSKEGAWVLHDGVGYLLPQTVGAVMHVSNINRTGTWSSIGVGSDTPVTRAIFDLYITHDDEYQYIILPTNNTVATMPTALSAGGGYTLAGGADSGFRAGLDPSGNILLGAVWDTKYGAVNIGCWSVTASRASAFILHKRPNNSTLEASASVPGADGGNLTLVIDDSGCEQVEHGPILRGGDRVARLVEPSQSRPARTSPEPGCKVGKDGALELEFVLPTGDYSGSSVSVACTVA